MSVTTPHGSTTISKGFHYLSGLQLYPIVGALDDIVYDQPRQRLYITNQDHNRVEVFDLSGGKYLVPIPVGNQPTALALTPDGARLAVINSADGTVSVVDPSAAQVVPTLSGTNLGGFGLWRTDAKHIAGQAASDTTKLGLYRHSGGFELSSRESRHRQPQLCGGRRVRLERRRHGFQLLRLIGNSRDTRREQNFSCKYIQHRAGRDARLDGQYGDKRVFRRFWRRSHKFGREYLRGVARYFECPVVADFDYGL